MNPKRFALLMGLRAAASNAEGGMDVLINLAITEIEQLDDQVNQLLTIVSNRHQADPVQTALDIAAIFDDNTNGEASEA